MTANASAPQRLYLMQVAHFIPDVVPVPCYLIQMDDGTNILIDTGLPVPLDPAVPAVLEKDVIEQLATIGLQPDDIDLLITTHFDGDHAGNHGAFAHAEFIVQRAHYTHARSSPRFDFTRSQWDQPNLRYRLLDGDTQLLPGLDLIETSGHTLGHQAVLVRLPETGAVLLTADAVPEQKRFTPDRQASSNDEDEALLRASTRKLLDLVEREQISWVIFGHDAEQWRTLKKAPEHYS